MGYFRADERYLNGGGKTTVEPPWRIEVRETGEPGQVCLTWRRPYAPVDSFGIYGQDTAGPAPAAWQELLRVPGTAAEARIRLEPGAWQLAVNARHGAADSPRIPAVPALPTPAAQPLRVAASLPVPEPVLLPQPPLTTEHPPAATEHGTRNTEHGTRNNPHYNVPLPFGAGRNDHNARREREPPPPDPVPEPAPELDWTAIDNALRANSAHLGRHGLFVRPTADGYDDRYR